MTPNFETIATVIRNRRTTKATAMNGQQIPNEQIDQLMSLADHAPTHGRTEPWRFMIYTGTSLEKFCNDHAQLYWDNTPEESRLAQTFENLKHQGNMVSHLVVTLMKRTEPTKIPLMEEYAATSAAMQNILLGAEALGLAAIWSTGGMALKQPMKDYFSLSADDFVVGFIYLGYSDQPKKEAQRNIPLTEKVTWA